LADFHAGLLAGRTAGIVVDRYRRMPGDAPGVAARRAAAGAAVPAALKALTGRARLWVRRLRGVSVRELDDVRQTADALRVAALVRGRRRYILVFNASSSDYVRDTVHVPARVAGLPVRRAVPVATSRARTTGDVLSPARRGRVVLPVALRPGDAVLFELF
ncbi:MAG: hypothetical protein ACE5E6_05505, partial [Phycisphaerae bacterium]